MLFHISSDDQAEYYSIKDTATFMLSSKRLTAILAELSSMNYQVPNIGGRISELDTVLENVKDILE